MSDKIIPMPVQYCTPLTDGKVISNKVLAGADHADLEEVLVIGTHKESGELYFATSEGDTARVNFLLDKAKFFLLGLTK